jgi:hypothetical protein
MLTHSRKDLQNTNTYRHKNVDDRCERFRITPQFRLFFANFSRVRFFRIRLGFLHRILGFFHRILGNRGRNRTQCDLSIFQFKHVGVLKDKVLDGTVHVVELVIPIFDLRVNLLNSAAFFRMQHDDCHHGEQRLRQEHRVWFQLRFFDTRRVRLMFGVGRVRFGFVVLLARFCGLRDLRLRYRNHQRQRADTFFKIFRMFDGIVDLRRLHGRKRSNGGEVTIVAFAVFVMHTKLPEIKQNQSTKETRTKKRNNTYSSQGKSTRNQS